MSDKSVHRPATGDPAVKRLPELRDLDVFVRVSEAGSFRRAARALDLQPSAVSRRVRALEDRLGSSLFERRSSGVRATNAGREFGACVQDIMARLALAVRVVQTAGAAEVGRVSIGICGSPSPYLSELIQRFRAERPEVELTIVERRFHDLLHGLSTNEIDVAMVFGRLAPEGYEAEVLWSEQVFVALPKDKVGTFEAALSLRDIQEENFIVSCDLLGQDVYDLLIRKLSGVGVRPRVRQYRVSRETIIAMVGLHFGVSLVWGGGFTQNFPNVTFSAVSGEKVDFSAVWSPNRDNPALRRLMSLARQFARELHRIDAAS